MEMVGINVLKTTGKSYSSNTLLKQFQDLRLRVLVAYLRAELKTLNDLRNYNTNVYIIERIMHN